MISQNDGLPGLGSIMAAILLLFTGCTPAVPERFHEEFRLPDIYPDYTSVTIPPNVAPLNFRIEEPGDEFLVRFVPDAGPPLRSRGPVIEIPMKRWQKLLTANRGGEIGVEIFVREKSRWKKFRKIVNRVAAEPIDPYVAYRLVEPGFEQYREIRLCQRNLENFEERCFYDNLRMVGEKGQCANCHAFRDYRTETMMFHTRGYRGGTVLVRDGVAEKIDLSLKNRAISAATYPAWHPTQNLLAFSVNRTSQHFHTAAPEKVEVLDIASDLLLYDLDRDEISFVLLSINELETYPAWSRDGNFLYYCNAKVDWTNADVDQRRNQALRQANETRYDLMRIPFDPATKRFGKPELLVDAASQQKNVTFPRPSPDGRYVMYTLSDAGCFSIWHPESDLWILDLQSRESRPLTEANSDATESFHCWSSNGRWFVFSSRRDDGLYTRLYFSYFDEQGCATKPFLLPQRLPDHNRNLMKSYNVPEMTIEPIRIDFHDLVRAVQAPGHAP